MIRDEFHLHQVLTQTKLTFDFKSEDGGTLEEGMRHNYWEAQRETSWGAGNALFLARGAEGPVFTL